MGTQTTITLIDDLDGTTAEETIEFGLNGTRYAIDLNAKHAKTFRKAVAPYIDHGRKIHAPRQPRRGRGAARASNQQIRMWARRQGLKVSDRGRIAVDVAEKYQAAHTD